MYMCDMLLNPTLVTYRYVDFKSPNPHVGGGIMGFEVHTSGNCHGWETLPLKYFFLFVSEVLNNRLYIDCPIIGTGQQTRGPFCVCGSAQFTAIQVEGFCLVSFEITVLSLLSQTSVGGKAVLSVYADPDFNAILVHVLTSHEKLELLRRKLGSFAVLYSSFTQIISICVLPVGVVITFKDHH